MSKLTYNEIYTYKNASYSTFWTITLITSMTYLMCVTYVLLSQNINEAREMLKMFDAELGKPLSEKVYGENCVIYNSSQPDDPFHNVWHEIDWYMLVHLIGWWCKTIIYRDFTLAMIHSILFEILEYTYAIHMPSLSECWYDKLFADILLANTLGILLAIQTVNYFSMQKYDWNCTNSLDKWIRINIMLFIFLIGELNNFYLAHILWIPALHYVCTVRSVIYLGLAFVATENLYGHFENGDAFFHVGIHCYMSLLFPLSEILLIWKWGYSLVTIPVPHEMVCFWMVFIISMFTWTVWKFGFNIDGDKKIKSVDYDDNIFKYQLYGMAALTDKNKCNNRIQLSRNHKAKIFSFSDYVDGMEDWKF